MYQKFGDRPKNDLRDMVKNERGYESRPSGARVKDGKGRNEGFKSTKGVESIEKRLGCY